MNAIFEYIIVFIIVFIFNYFLFIKNKQKYNKNKIPVELFYLKRLYNISYKKINYKQFVWVYSLINTFIITTTYIIIVKLVNGVLLQIIIGIVLLVLLIIICYGLLGRYYKQKEDDKNV